MKLMLIRHLWGVNKPWAQAFAEFKNFGYQGIEWGLPPTETAAQFRELLKLHHFHYIPQIYTQGSNVREHLRSFSKQIEAAAQYQPLFVNAHSGRDAFSEADAVRFFKEALNIERKAGFRVVHETHRGRILYNPWITMRLLARFNELKLCCDFSHWVCVSERLLDNDDLVATCAGRCHHLHARVGYEQGPQVADPRAPEYRRHLEAHERWWKTIWLAQAGRGDAVTTLAPEFGPPPYQQTLAFTQMPVSNLEEICDWQARREAAIFSRLFSKGKRATAV